MNKLLIARFPGDPPQDMVRLVTNEVHFRDQFEGVMRRETSSDPTLLRTRTYLASVLEGKAGRPHCPFVRAIEDQNGYFVIPDERTPGDVDLSSTVDRLVSEFGQLSSLSTQANQSLDVTSVVAAFGHSEAMTPAFCAQLDAARNRTRLEVLRLGLMLSQMHPFHPREAQGQSVSGRITDERKYQAQIPLLIVRRMHAPDRVFIRTAEEKAAYDQYFGEDVLPDGYDPQGWFEQIARELAGIAALDTSRKK